MTSNDNESSNDNTTELINLENANNEKKSANETIEFVRLENDHPIAMQTKWKQIPSTRHSIQRRMML
jgi:hypothetical protein